MFKVWELAKLSSSPNLKIILNKDQETENNSVFSYINNFINRYTSLPTADALVPINPTRMPSYYIGSTLTSDQRLERNDFMQP